MYVIFLTFAFARTDGGITLSGPKACLGSMKEGRDDKNGLCILLGTVRISFGGGLCIPFTGDGGGALGKL